MKNENNLIEKMVDQLSKMANCLNDTLSVVKMLNERIKVLEDQVKQIKQENRSSYDH